MRVHESRRSRYQFRSKYFQFRDGRGESSGGSGCSGLGGKSGGGGRSGGGGSGGGGRSRGHGFLTDVTTPTEASIE